MCVFRNKGLPVKNKSMKDLQDLTKQVSVFIKFVRLNRSKNSSGLFKPKPLIFRSMLKSPINNILIFYDGLT